MIKRTLIVSFLASGVLLFGQLDSNSVTVTASRSTNLQPDQVLFAVEVGSGLNTSLDDVLAALKGSGITIGNFSGVGSSGGIFSVLPPGPQLPPMLQWAFGLAVPFSKMKDTVTALTSLQQSIAQANNGLMLSFQVQGSSVSAALQQSQTCSIPDLLADARTQAQKLADAAGLTLGSILAMSGSTATLAGSSNIPVAVGLSSFVSSGLLANPQFCGVTVKFGLTRF
jgi:hypothetical protein